MMTNTKKITFTAIGIALYVVLSMSMKIPLIAHISLDLGYIAFALYCYHFGAISGMIVGGVGCVLISLITTGWFPPGWFLGNLVIGLICGCLYKKDATIRNIITHITQSINCGTCPCISGCNCKSSTIRRWLFPEETVSGIS